MACWRPSLTSYIVGKMLQLLSLTCFLHVFPPVSSYEALRRPLISYLKADLVFPPCLRLLSIAPVFPSFSQVPEAIPWALISFCQLSRDLPALMAQLKDAPMLICACCVHAAYLGILLLVGLGLGASHWLVLGIAHFLPIAGSFTWLPLNLWLHQCLFVLVRHL